MNGAQQLELAEALRAALAGEPHRPMLIEEAARGSNGQIVRWAPVPAITIIGLLARHGYKLSLTTEPEKRPMHLHRTEGPEL